METMTIAEFEGRLDDLAATAPEGRVRLEEIPVVEVRPGEVGHGKVERLFCKAAHEVVRGERTMDELPHLDCEHLWHGCCLLTGARFLCLFAQRDDPQWEVIRWSEAVQIGTKGA